MKYLLALSVAASALAAFARQAPAELSGLAAFADTLARLSVHPSHPPSDALHSPVVPSDDGLDVCPAAAGGAMAASPHVGAEPAHPWHPAAGEAPVDSEVGVVSRSTAQNGHTIAQLFSERAALRNTTVRVRGVVVKQTEGILGKTYLHLRDGSGSTAQGNDDLTVTSEQAFTLGETVEIEGRLGVDEDPGVGYRYPLLLTGARGVGKD